MLASYHIHTTGETLRQVERLATQYKNDVLIFKDLKPKEFFYLVSTKIMYEPDPPGIERVCRPDITLKLRSGDCDDKTVLCLAYFLVNKIPCGYSIVSQKSNKKFHHIFPFIVVDNKIIDFDATYKKNKPYVTQKWTNRKDFFIKGV